MKRIWYLIPLLLLGLVAIADHWAQAQDPILANWQSAYWNNTSLSGVPMLRRNITSVNFNWGIGSPASDVDDNNFSARWTQTIALPAGTYNFRMTVDDGGRLWFNRRLLVDVWQVQLARTYASQTYLPGGPTPIEMEYFENRGEAVAQLSWNRIGDLPQTSADWRDEIPARWHPLFQRCLDTYDRIGLQIGSSPDWDTLLEECQAVTSSR